MYLTTKLVKDGNSWALRLPKTVLSLAGFKPKQNLFIEVRRDRIIIWTKQKEAEADYIQKARKDAKKAWDQAFEDTWRRVVGEDE